MMSIHQGASLEERVSTAYRRLVAIEAAAAAEEDQILGDTDDRLVAIQELAHEAADVLAPLKNAPAAVGNWTPPDDAADPAGHPTPPARRRLHVVPPSAPSDPVAS